MLIFFRFVKYIVFSIFLIIIPSLFVHAGSQVIKADITRTGTISERDIREASGLAASRINEDIIWVINDSGNSASVYAINPKGKRVGTLKIEGVSNNDWEDIASFEYDGKSYILIADVGDNYAKRSKCFLHFIEEPDIKKVSNSLPLIVKPSWSITYIYEDGPRDCEAVAVDTVNKKILLLSKRNIPPVLYELPLTKQKNAVAKKLGEINPLPQRTLDIMEPLKYSNQPTAMDISADGSIAVILTYSNAYYFTKKPSEDWLNVFTASAKEIIIPHMRQAESVCFSRDGSSLFITSEQIPAPIYKIDVTDLEE